MVLLLRYTPAQIAAINVENLTSTETETYLQHFIQSLLTNGKAEAMVASAVSHFSDGTDPMLLQLAQRTAASMYEGVTPYPDYTELTDRLSKIVGENTDEVTSLLKARVDGSDSSGLDIYNRTVGGDSNDIRWSQGLARILTTRVREAVKDDLATSLGLDSRKWATMMDGRVRDSHAILEGQEKPADEPFISGAGNPLMRPGDPEAPLNERINCRCSLVWFRKTSPGQ